MIVFGGNQMNLQIKFRLKHGEVELQCWMQLFTIQSNRVGLSINYAITKDLLDKKLESLTCHNE